MSMNTIPSTELDRIRNIYQKDKFLKDTSMAIQTRKTDEIEMDIDLCNTDQDEDTILKEDVTLPRKSNRHDQFYSSLRKVF